MRRILATLVALLYATSAAAQTTSITKEIVAFNTVDVRFVDSANKCNLNDIKLFEELAQRRALGIDMLVDRFKEVRN